MNAHSEELITKTSTKSLIYNLPKGIYMYVHVHVRTCTNISHCTVYVRTYKCVPFFLTFCGSGQVCQKWYTPSHDPCAAGQTGRETSTGHSASPDLVQVGWNSQLVCLSPSASISPATSSQPHLVCNWAATHTCTCT